MKRLVFVRHSVAEIIDKQEDDINRNLTSEGINRINLVVKQIHIETNKNAIYLSSPANRCIQTAEIFAKYFNIQNIKIESFLYSCFREHSFYYFLEELIPEENNVWIFGHNPMLSNLTDQLLNKKFYSLPKCAVVIFESTSLNWLELNHENTQLTLFVNPKELK